MTLTIQDLGALGEFFGSIAVLATLVYLALQTRQNTMAIAAQLDAARLGAIQSGFMAPATSNELAEAIREDSAPDATTDQVRLGMYWASILYSFTWQLQQVRLGLLPASEEAILAGSVRSFFTGSRGFESWGEGIRSLFPPDFTGWVEEQRAKATGQEA